MVSVDKKSLQSFSLDARGEGSRLGPEFETL